MTELTNITIDDTPATAPIRAALDEYMAGRGVLYTSRKKARTLMDMATLAVKELRAQGGLKEIDESEEINACTIVVPVDVNGKTEEWLLLFKTKRTIIRRKSNLTAVLPLVSAVVSATR